MDPQFLSALAVVLTAAGGVVTALAALVWAFRRRP
jgi:hypothetical protein